LRTRRLPCRLGESGCPFQVDRQVGQRATTKQEIGAQRDAKRRTSRDLNEAVSELRLFVEPLNPCVGECRGDRVFPDAPHRHEIGRRSVRPGCVVHPRALHCETRKPERRLVVSIETRDAESIESCRGRAHKRHVGKDGQGVAKSAPDELVARGWREQLERAAKKLVLGGVDDEVGELTVDHW
jgi:hypothetical protein